MHAVTAKLSGHDVQAIAASPDGAVNGYALGSLLYLGVVLTLGMGLPLGGLALDLPVRVYPAWLS